MSIELRGTDFEKGPTPLRKFDSSDSSGIYAILTPTEKEHKWRVLYFGESGHLSKRGFPDTHEKYPCWKKEAGSDNNIYIAIHSMIGKSMDERKKKETELIHSGNGMPPCNEK